VPVSREEQHGVTGATDVQAVAVALDLVHPAGPDRRLDGAHWKSRGAALLTQGFNDRTVQFVGTFPTALVVRTRLALPFGSYHPGRLSY
jgi:hypothetical protein